MWSYIIRRLLYMVPMLFFISLINFALINLAPPPSTSNVLASGDYDASKSLQANEGEHIFRQTFNLDKPRFFNPRYALKDDEILWRLTSVMRTWERPAQRRGDMKRLDDYGRTIVPHLIRIGELADSGRDAFRTGPLREAYAERWRDARDGWLADGRPPGVETWPPPEEPPAFDDAFCDRLLELTLGRLANNAPRRPIALFGDAATDEILVHNREVRKEQVRLQQIWLDRKATNSEKLARWKEWYEEHRAEWHYGFWDKVHMFFLETRFAKFWGNLLRLDLGRSFIHKKRVWDLILERIPISLTLSVGSLILAYLLSIPLGILSTVTHRSLSDRIISTVLFAGYSMPTIFLGVLLVTYFAIDWKLFPVSGFNSTDYANETVLSKIGDRAAHVALPLITLTVGWLALLSRYMKAGLIDIIRADFVRTARAKGLSELVVVLKHALRNGLIPIITLLGASLPAVLGGSIIVEVIFQIDGMGKFALEAVLTRDYAVIMGINILVAALTLVGVFLADLAYAIVDPRISYK